MVSGEQMILRLGRRLDRDAEETGEFFLARRATAFDDIRHNRIGNTRQLTAKLAES